MKLDEYLQIARSRFSNETKKILSIYFNGNFDVLKDCLNYKFGDKLASIRDIKKEINEVKQNKCHFLTINDSSYPEFLKKIDDAPVVLTFKGNKEILKQNNVAIVGSRKLEKEDYKIITNAVECINDINSNVVSGLAYGTDILSHIKSLEYGTIAVIPCGLCNCYPKEHSFLLDKIVDFNGAVISEFNFNEPAKQNNFIQRNRIIVGISYATIIMRARLFKCGSMSSANYAIKFDRSLYTFNFKGENLGNKYLINKDYAKLVENLSDLKKYLLNDIVNTNFINEKIDCKMKQNNKSLFEIEKKQDIAKIIKNSGIKPIEGNFYKFFNMCKNETNIDSKDIIIEILMNLNN